MNFWAVSPSELPPLDQSVHVWAVRLDDSSVDLDDARAQISLDERERAAKFHFELHRRRYLIAHLALHRILARYLQAEPGQIAFQLGNNGKPYLNAAFAGSGVQFNLSHSYEMALIAVGAGDELGVDIESEKRDFEFHDIAERFFTAREVAALRSLPLSLQRQGFFKCWTSKEAFLKAKGTGLSGKLDEVEITLADPDHVEIRADVPGWSLTEINPVAGYEAALVTQQKLSIICNYFWSAQSSV